MPFLGAGVDYADGYVGCMSSLQNNGEVLNLYEKVSSGQFTYGLSLGEFPKYLSLQMCSKCIRPSHFPSRRRHF